MTRGNQREIDRARAAARHAGKGEKSVGDPSKRREDDGNALKAKLEAKAAREKAEKEVAEAKAKFEAEKKTAGGVKDPPEDAKDGGTAKPPTSKTKKKKKEDLSLLDGW